MLFITNGYERFSNTNSTDPRQRVPLFYCFLSRVHYELNNIIMMSSFTDIHSSTQNITELKLDLFPPWQYRPNLFENCINCDLFCLNLFSELKNLLQKKPCPHSPDVVNKSARHPHLKTRFIVANIISMIIILITYKLPREITELLSSRKKKKMKKWNPQNHTIMKEYISIFCTSIHQVYFRWDLRWKLLNRYHYQAILHT